MNGPMNIRCSCPVYRPCTCNAEWQVERSGKVTSCREFWAVTDDEGDAERGDA